MKTDFNPHRLGRHSALSVAIAAMAALGADTCHAQASASPQRFSPDAEGYMERARTMLDAGNYPGAIDQLKMLRTRNTDLSLLDALSPGAAEEYVFMLADALFKRGDRECLAMLRDFISRYPASPHALEARLAIGDYYFYAHQWNEALENYDTIDFERLNHTQLALYSYRKALCLIKTGNGKDARSALRRIADIPEYSNAAKFYLAYLDYSEGNLDKAYEEFKKVKPTQDGICPEYYIAQIDFAKGRYENVILTGSSLLKKNQGPELKPETERIVGLSFFKTGGYSSARRYLESYMKSTPGEPSAEASYALGVIDYHAADYEGAAKRLEPLTSLDSDLGQSAWLYLGQCDLKNGNPDAAAMAFEKAARMDYDREVTETALYNYAAALTRGGKIPFSSSAELMERFIARYPDSEYTPKVEEYLATAYYNDRNYRQALRNIESIKKPSAKVLAAKQKILYELGVESTVNGSYEEAAKYLRAAIALSSHDAAIAAQSQLWLGDALYAMADFKGAKTAYRKAASSLPSSSNRTLALYNEAYTSYSLNDYSQAAREFANAISATPTLPKTLKDDATIRRADCLYYTGNYSAAREAYAEAIRNEAADADYASYRHAVMLGLGNDIKGKIKELSEIPTKYPGSKWIAGAVLEKAMTYEASGQTAAAAEAYREVARQYPDAPQARKALLSLALAEAKKGDMQASTDAYKEIIRRWPSSEEANMANDDLKKYYASIGELTELSRFLASVPGARQLDPGEMEQLAFDGAEIAYTDNSNNISLLRNYVRDYPDGKYLAQALLDIAYSEREQRQYAEAEETLSRLISARPHSVQAPEALLMKAEILEYNLNRQKDALLAYRELERLSPQEFGAEAAAGIMRTTSDSSERLAYARKTAASGGLSAEMLEEARLTEAEALLDLGRSVEAVKILSQLASNPAGEAGAKAAVLLAQHYLDTKQYKLAEETALNFTDAGSPHEFWLAKGFIALADAYHAQGRTLLAKEYLQSLKDNFPGNNAEISNDIASRLKSWK